MNFNITEMEGLSGKMAHIYSVILSGEGTTLLEQFFEENSEHKIELEEIFNRILIMGHETGCRRHYFKLYEGKPGDGVAALRVGQLRLYCLYFDKTAVLKNIAAKINRAIVEKDITINEDGSLNINFWDYE